MTRMKLVLQPEDMGPILEIDAIMDPCECRSVLGYRETLKLKLLDMVEAMMREHDNNG